MRRRWLVNLGLAAAVALLALLAWRKPGLAPEPANPPLTTIDTATVTEIAISNGGEQTLRLIRAGEQWRLSAPVDLPATAFRVDSLLELLAAEQFTAFPLPDAAARAKYGLGEGGREVRFNDLTVRFGDQNPVAIRRYVAIGDRGYLIDDRFHHHAIAPWNDWAERRLLPGDAIVDELQLPGFSLTSRDGGWRMTPDNGASADALSRFAAGWQHAYAMTVALAQPEPTAERLRIAWHREADAEPQTLDAVIAKRDDRFALIVPARAVEYRFTTESAARLLSQPQPEPPSAAAPSDAAD